MMTRICLFAAALVAAFVCPVRAHDYFVAQSQPRASDTNPGTVDRPFATITAAAKVAGPGDTVTVGSGVYRESVILTRGGELGRPVVYRAAAGADVLIKGSDIATGWKRITRFLVAGISGVGNVWWDESPKLVGRPDLFVFRREQVFIDGKILKQVPTVDQLAPNCYTVHDPTGRMLLCLSKGDEPSSHVIEVSTRECLWGAAKPIGYVTVRGLRFSHGANDPESKGVSLEHCTRCVLEDIEVTWMNGGGVRLGGSSDCVLRRVRANYNGCTGISGGEIQRLRLEQCQTNYNNQKGYPIGWEAGGVKLLALKDSVITDHESCYNTGFGIWLDWACNRNRVTRSLCFGNTESGFDFEASRGPTWVDNCIAAFNGHDGSFFKSGFYAHDSDNLRLVHNLAYGNAGYGIRIRFIGGRTNNEDHKEVSCRGNRIANNLLIANGTAGVEYPADREGAANNRSDGNVISGSFAAIEYVAGNVNMRGDIERVLEIKLEPWLAAHTDAGVDLECARLTLAQWRQLTGNDTGSQHVSFKLLDPNAGNFRPVEGQTLPNGLSLDTVTTGLPPDAWGALPWPADERHPVGPFDFPLDQRGVVGKLKKP